MNINIPDKFYKLLIAIGIAFFIYSLYISNNLWDRYEKVYAEYQDELYKVKKLDLLLKEDVENLIAESHTLSLKYDVEDQIVNGDTIITFNKTLKGNNDEVLVTKLLTEKWNKYKQDKFALQQEKLILNQKDKNLESELEYKRNTTEGEIIQIQILAAIFFLPGILIWMIDELKSNDEVIVKQNEKIYRRCQSCGERFSAVRLYGTNRDNSYNLGLCNSCYKDGEFISLNLNEEEYKEYVETKIAQYNKRKKKKLTKFYFNLERWKKSDF